MERAWAERREIETFLPHGLPPPLLFLPPAVPGSPRTPEWRGRWPKKGGGGAASLSRAVSPSPTLSSKGGGAGFSRLLLPSPTSPPYPSPPRLDSSSRLPLHHIQKKRRGQRGREGGGKDPQVRRGKGRRDRGRKGRIRGEEGLASQRKWRSRGGGRGGLWWWWWPPPSTFSKAKSLLCSPSLFPFPSFLPLLPRPLLSNSLLSGRGKKAPLEALKERKRWVGLSPISSLSPPLHLLLLLFPPLEFIAPTVPAGAQ